MQEQPVSVSGLCLHIARQIATLCVSVDALKPVGVALLVICIVARVWTGEENCFGELGAESDIENVNINNHSVVAVCNSVQQSDYADD